MIVGNVELSKKLHELLRRHGLPAHTRSFDVHVEVDDLVTVDCSFYPSLVRKRAPRPAKPPKPHPLAAIIAKQNADWEIFLLETRVLRALRRVADGR